MVYQRVIIIKGNNKFPVIVFFNQNEFSCFALNAFKSGPVNFILLNQCFINNSISIRYSCSFYDSVNF